ncbi:MAG: nuclear transport factor 2 family protein [Vicinamibacterales bacterium]
MALDDVRKASEQFYSALNRMVNGDARALADIWAHDPDVTTLHPIGGRQIGWDDVRGSWEAVARLSTEGRVALEEQHLLLAGDMACEVGVENGTLKLAGHLINIGHNRVTNVYRRGTQGWKIVHHHTDMSPAMVDILRTVQRSQ